MIVIFIICFMGAAALVAFAVKAAGDGMGLLSFGLAVIFAAMALFFVLIPFAVLQEENSPDLATLKKKDFICTSSHKETTWVMAGKVLVPLTNEVCDQYGRVQK